MKATDNFRATIKAYLDGRAEEDILFSFKYSAPRKNIDDCVTYILNTVQKSGCNGFADDEIFGMAVHYYDEDNIEIGTPMDCRVMVNHHVELSEEEKQQARKAAIERAQNEAYSRMIQPKRKQTVQQVTNNQLSLF